MTSPKKNKRHSERKKLNDTLTETLNETLKSPKRNPFERLVILIRNPDKKPYMKP